jgi:hypothetical protein
MDRLPELWRAIAVPDVGRMHDRSHQQTIGVDENMTFAALDFLAGIKAARAAGLAGLDRLTVDHAGRRAGLAALRLAAAHQENVIELQPHPTGAPAIEVALHRYFSGWRLGEMKSLQWRDVDLPGKAIHLRPEHSRSKRGRVLRLRGELLASSSGHWTDTALLASMSFAMTRDKPLRTSAKHGAIPAVPAGFASWCTTSVAPRSGT